MKKSNITIPFDDEKLQALRLFSGKKDADIDAELEDAVQKLYEKYVPRDARELVEMMTGGTGTQKAKTTKKATTPKPTPSNEEATATGTTGSDRALTNSPSGSTSSVS